MGVLDPNRNQQLSIVIIWLILAIIAVVAIIVIRIRLDEIKQAETT